MAFAQLAYRESLRDIEACWSAVGLKLYHMGFGSVVARSTLADANENRDLRIFADFAQVLIRIAMQLCAHDATAMCWAAAEREKHRVPVARHLHADELDSRMTNT
jgi:hypothetical protein